MEKALTDEAFYRELKAHALTQSAKFSWANTAHLAIDGFTRLLQSSKEVDAGQTEGVTTSRIQTMQKIDALSEVDRLGLAWAVARNGYKQHTRKLLVDISVLAKHDAKTGIQRVSRSILSELLKSGVPGYEVSAVYYTLASVIATRTNICPVISW
ncbi:hypothetical protein QNH14_24045 (plasmid) [Apirhabdus apintestini]|nr:hypothetical protein QNH14_24045 [Enterobacteriaceae bacterium CA-0114]